VGDQQDVSAVHHSDGLPARLAFDFAILRRYLKWIVKDQDCVLEADAMLLPVPPVLACVPGKLLVMPS
jgi:hypothetical protein